MAKATLINSAGQKVVVESGSPEAQTYFSQGYKLMGATPTPTPAPTPAPTPTPTPTPSPTPAPANNVQKATLYSPDGQKRVVVVGSGEASQLQTQGWSLNTPAGNPSLVDPGNGSWQPPTGYQRITDPGQITNYEKHVKSPDGKTMYGIPKAGAPGYVAPDTTFADAGTAGLTVAELDNIAQRKNTLTDADITKIYGELGITDLVSKTFAIPAVKTTQVYNTKYNELGLGDLKSRIESKIADMDSKKEALNAKLGEVGENPWLTEASRVGRQKRLQDLASNDIDNLNDEINQLKDLYNQGIGEIGTYITNNSTDFANEQSLNTAKLNYLLNQAEMKIGVKTDEKMAKAYEALPEYLKNVAGASSSKNAPQVFGGATVGYWTYNAQTGSYDNIVPAEKSGGGSGGASFSSMPTTYKEWSLAGGLEGTGQSYADWAKKESGSQPTEAELLRVDIGDMTTMMDQVVGEDGFVNPEDYNDAKTAWVKNAQRPAKSFDDYFSIYRNPENPYYKIEGKDENNY